MIIVCGVDNTGKTTLVKHLAKKFNLKEVPKYHTLPPTDGGDWANWVVGSLVNDDGTYIADRFYVEEFVYGPILRGKICIGTSMKKAVDHIFRKNNPLIIWCDTDVETIRKTFGERAQLEGVYDQVGKLKSRFKDVLSTYPFDEVPVINYNFKRDGDYQNIDQVIEAWAKKARRKDE